MAKPTKWHVRPAKTQISLGIRPVWSESSLCAQWVATYPSFLHADCGDSDQTGRMPRLIWVFAVRTCHVIGFVMRWIVCLVSIILVIPATKYTGSTYRDLCALRWLDIPVLNYLQRRFCNFLVCFPHTKSLQQIDPLVITGKNLLPRGTFWKRVCSERKIFVQMTITFKF